MSSGTPTPHPLRRREPSSRREGPALTPRNLRSCAGAGRPHTALCRRRQTPSQGRAACRLCAAESLLGGDGRRSVERTEAGDEARFLVRGEKPIRLLDMTEASYLELQGGELDRGGMVRGRKTGDDLAKARLVIDDRPALGAALLGAAENIERRAAQPLEPRQHAERGQYPRPVLALPQMPAGRVALGDERRREVEFEGVRPLELLAYALQEISVGIEPRDLVFVLVGHQPEERVGGGVGERGVAGDRRGLGGADPLDPTRIARRVGGVLIAGQEIGAAGDRLIERRGQAVRLRRRAGRDGARGDEAAVDRRAAAPTERAVGTGPRRR